MEEMLVLVLVLVVGLQFEGTRGGETIHLFHKEGENVVLPCNSDSSFSSCSKVIWLYNRYTSQTDNQVIDGKVDQRSSRASRISLGSSCSLIINNIIADDAGLYTCRPGSGTSSDGSVFLSVLTISDSHPTEEGFTLHCSLWRHGDLGSCPGKSFHWLDETRTELTGESSEHSGHRSLRQRCFSSLTVKHQSDTNRSFTCQFIEGNKVKVEAQHTRVHLYHRAGDEAVLPCNRPSSSDSCSSVDWSYERKTDDRNRKQEVHEGIVQRSSRSARLSLDTSCSLIINNITADDAGRYTCSYDSHVYLNVMSISSKDADPKNNELTLSCSLERFWSGSCPVKSVFWVDEAGSELTGGGDGYKSGEQKGCVHDLIVNLQSSRRFTCRFVEGKTVKIETHYGSEAGSGNISSTIIIILVGSAIGVLLLLVVVAAVFIKHRKTKNKEDHKTTTENQDSATENHQYDELQANLTYTSVSHSKPSEKIKVKTYEDTVTYSAVRTKNKTEADINPSDLYSSLTEPK